jgi:hypothetical protein
MLYFQIYLLIGTVYTFYVYDDFSDAILNQMIKQDPSLASMYSREFYIAAKLVSLLLVFAWPIQLIEVLIRGNK